MSKCLVTGGAGFIGSNLVDKLIKRGDKVVIIDNLSTGKKEYLNPKAKFKKLDICSSKTAEIFRREKFDYVFHLAAQIDVRKSVEDPVFDNLVNVGGSLNIYKNCSEFNVKKIIFLSTGGVYGNVDAPVSEEAPVYFDAPYAVHKFTSEKNLEVFNKIHDLNYAILRAANVYGPRQYKGGEGAVVAVFTHNALGSKESIVYGDGQQTRDFIYVHDVAEACIKAATSDVQGVFNVSSGKEVAILNLIQVIENVTGKKFKFRHNAARPGEVRRSVLNSTKAKKLLHWSPQINLEEGIKKTIEWSKSKI